MLPCVVSGNLTSECKVNDNYVTCSLGNDMNVWIDNIIGVLGNRNEIDISDLVKNYDIKSLVSTIEDIY